jgi:hypothetical protein
LNGVERREIGRRGRPCHEDLAVLIHGDLSAVIEVSATKVGGVKQRRAATKAFPLALPDPPSVG